MVVLCLFISLLLFVKHSEPHLMFVVKADTGVPGGALILEYLQLFVRHS
jgi:hypothetical protein